MVLFVGDHQGKAKTTGNEFHVVTLMEVKKSKKEGDNGKIVGRVVEFFVSKLDCSSFVCGDVVKVEFEESEILGGRPELIGLEKTGENVFEAIL